MLFRSISYETGHRVDGVTPWTGQVANDGDISTRDVALSFHSGPAIVFGSCKAPLPEHCRQVLIWDKGPALGMGALDIPWKPSYEEIYIIGYGWVGKRDEGSVLYCPPVQSMAKNGRVHPNEKPLPLLARLLAKAPQGTILDPFMGSGTTLRAAKDLGRKCIGIEIEEKYCEIAVKRLAQEVLSF